MTALTVLEAAYFPALAIEPLGAGHINDTYLVRAVDGRYVLQRINAQVFPDPCAVMEKVVTVLEHLARVAPGSTPQLIATRSGAPYTQDESGAVWRLWRYLEGSRTLQRLDNVGQAQAAGFAFGAFEHALRALQAPISDPIPGFMQAATYLDALDGLLASNGVTPDDGTLALLAQLEPRRELAALFGARDRLVHGDCKVNNLLFDAGSDRVLCVLDLDTVMRGHWAWDFGDLARSGAADGSAFACERFAALARGFRAGAGIDADADDLVLAPRYVAAMLAVRFVTDHLAGDRYFRVSRRGENLLRAREQLDLLLAMERAEGAMRRALRGA
ncbi:MAG: aminoglycoside phosphotransferase family protein [Pseudomonadales bacterium]